jgi:hypothetical protein
MIQVNNIYIIFPRDEIDHIITRLWQVFQMRTVVQNGQKTPAASRCEPLRESDMNAKS